MRPLHLLIKPGGSLIFQSGEGTYRLDFDGEPDKRKHHPEAKSRSCLIDSILETTNKFVILLDGANPDTPVAIAQSKITGYAPLKKLVHQAFWAQSWPRTHWYGERLVPCQ